MLSRLAFRRVRAVAGCTRYVVERDRRRFGLAADRTSVISNGVDLQRFAAAGPRATPPRICSVAYLIPEKGLDTLVEACGRLRELPWTLSIVGDGPELGRLQRIATNHGIADRVGFLGLRDDAESVYRDAEIYVHPSRWEEAFGLTIAEAMASECAVVASRVGGIPELIDHDRTGMLVEPGDVTALSEALAGLLADPLRRRRLGAAARAEAVAHFGLEKTVQAHVDWIERWGPNQERT